MSKEAKINKPFVLGALSEQEFNDIIEKGMQEYLDGNVQTAEEVRKQMKRDFGI